MQQSIDIQWLQGVRVLLTGHYIPAPLAAYLLQALGAEVIKVEPPFGDLLRQYPPYLQADGKSESAFFRSLNGGFRSLALDLKQEEGKEVLARMIAKVDIVFDGNRAGYIEHKLGKSIGEINPNCIHVPISAYGNRGPLREQAGHDNNLLALAGNLSYTPTDQKGQASVFSAPVADMGASYAAALVALAFLIGRGKQNNIQIADASMLHAAMFYNTLPLAGMNVEKQIPQADQEWMNGGMPNYSVYRCKGGGQVFLGCLEPHLFQKFCVAVKREEWLALLMAQKWPELKAKIAALFVGESMEHWESLLDGVDCCFTPLNNLEEALQEPQIQALKLIREVEDPAFGKLQFTGFPAGFGPESLPPAIDAEAPRIGQHSRILLSSLLAMDDSEIQGLVDRRIVKDGA